MSTSSVCNLRPCDTDTTSDVWLYRPHTHKTERHNRDRVIPIGPKGQDILRPYLLRETETFCFRPIDSEKKRREKQHTNRKTLLSCGNRPGTNRKRKPNRIAADTGYHANDQITECDRFGFRTYNPEPDSPHQRKWTDKSEETKRAALKNRRRTKRPKSKQIQKQRSEKVERSFAYVCETGGAKRTWLRGLEKINKRYSLVVAAHNLGIILRMIFGSGKPREAAAAGEGFFTQVLQVTLTLAKQLSQVIESNFPQLKTKTTSPDGNQPKFRLLPEIRNIQRAARTNDRIHMNVNNL